MSDRGKLVIPSNTRRDQARAADPALSIWVGANAGSGKTFVLTQRVLRLLLTGVSPQSILCLTYTKAAAAEMRSRVARSLGQWAVMPDKDLLKKLKELEGPRVDDKLLARARTLFARALETPGGLKIVTIHAFCESVLHRFPLEAGVPFDFQVIEDEERAGLVQRAREAVLAEGLRGEGVTDAVATLFDRLSDFQIEEAINLALSDPRRLGQVLAKPAVSRGNLRTLVDLGSDTVGDIHRALAEETLLSPDFIRDTIALLAPRSTGHGVINRLALLEGGPPRVETLREVFFKKTDGEPRNVGGTAAQRKANPALFDLLEQEAARVVTLFDRLSRTELVERSEALLDVVGEIVKRYEAHKRARSLLDFDDLVERLGNLFSRADAGAWVQYKLDSGIDHVLVDESQDTNGEQWRVVTAIAREFFDNAAAASRPRSLFAVGDQKQSIYSFQGAEPVLFDETGRHFAGRASEVGMPFHRVPLHTSFRTLPEILEAVDRVAALDGMQSALLEPEPVIHQAARVQTGGTVTLWPPIQQTAPQSALGAWPTEPIAGGERTAPRQLAERIAREIRGWIDRKRPLAGRGRAIQPRDVMVLVQSRGAVFQEVIRALRRENLPTPGADRLDVASHIAVLDLLALCDVLLNPADDLQLAALLRSPLFDIGETDLFDLAHDRPPFATLWSALEGCTTASCARAYEQLHRWRGELDFERPFEFLSQVLYAEGGLRRFHGRLGEEVDDVFAELLELALKHEQSEQPSLQGFVAAMRQTQVSVKRELAEAGNSVRVMTVHGAKGLEAPIVILADAATKPQGRLVSKPVYVLGAAPGPLLVHASRDQQHVPASARVRDTVEARLMEEYWRKLYVAMTRAEDELYVTGALTLRGKTEGTWYSKIEEALRPDSEVATDETGAETALIYPAERLPPHPVTKLEADPAPGARPQSFTPVPRPLEPTIVSPSSAGARTTPIHALDTHAEQVRDADQARQEGIALHALLQHLGKLDRALWPQVGSRAAALLLPEAQGRHQWLADKAIAILSRPELAQLFGSNSRAEVPFLVAAERQGTPIQLTGRIDRLVVDDSAVTVVDYKSDAVVPADAGAVPGNYVTQLGLYALVASQLFPGRPVQAAILWTALETLMILPHEQLRAATEDFTMR